MQERNGLLVLLDQMEKYIDSGAVKALKNGKSLLPAGIIKIDGEFLRR